MQVEIHVSCLPYVRKITEKETFSYLSENVPWIIYLEILKMVPITYSILPQLQSALV